MLSPFANFLNDAAGLEKTLRLIQCFTQIFIAVAMSAKDAAPWMQARSHLVVARRFFRIPKWVDAWQIAQQQFYVEGQDSLRLLLAVSKWSCLGMYMFLEMFTITDAMKVTNTSWGPGVLRESLKFWFYALVASIFLSLYDLFIIWTAEQPVLEKEKDDTSDISEKDTTKSGASSTSKLPTSSASAVTTRSEELYKKLLIDGCDILIPGSTLGWIPVDSLSVGITGCISTLTSMKDIWSRVAGSKR